MALPRGYCTKFAGRTDNSPPRAAPAAREDIPPIDGERRSTRAAHAVSCLAHRLLFILKNVAQLFERPHDAPPLTIDDFSEVPYDARAEYNASKIFAAWDTELAKKHRSTGAHP